MEKRYLLVTLLVASLLTVSLSATASPLGFTPLPFTEQVVQGIQVEATQKPTAPSPTIDDCHGHPANDMAVIGNARFNDKFLCLCGHLQGCPCFGYPDPDLHAGASRSQTAPEGPVHT